MAAVNNAPSAQKNRPVVVIDAGHGGNDPGKIGIDGTLEKDINLQITMKLKKFALRGLIVLAVLVALCMFFARTVQTITTPKVQLITASTGRFEEKMNFHAEIYFPKTEEITVEEAADLNVTVKAVHVKPGHYVKAGETIGSLTIIPCELLDGAHLHLELLSGDSYLDPLSIIDREVKFK